MHKWANKIGKLWKWIFGCGNYLQFMCEQFKIGFGQNSFYFAIWQIKNKNPLQFDEKTTELL